MIITTAVKPSPAVMATASKLASELGGAVINRQKRSVEELINASPTKQVIVVTEKEVRLYDDTGTPPFFYHPSMALIRVKRLLQGEPDVMLDVSKCEPGDKIIDCTAGLCGDSLVFSVAAGKSGKVMALESEKLLSSLVRQGLKAYHSGNAQIDAALRSIELHTIDHLEFLRSQPDKSADIVYFDPMFRRPIHESSSMQPLRQIANPAPLEKAAIEEACRVARKTVVLKEHTKSDQYHMLGLEQIVQGRTKIGYGVINID